MYTSFLALLLLISHATFANTSEKDSEDVAFAKEMTDRALDFHSLLDESLMKNNKSVMGKTAARLHEKVGDRDLAKMVIVVNRAPRGSAYDAQTAKVYLDGRLERTFSVSTGKLGYESRIGYFRPVYTNHLRFYHEYYSGKYGSRMARAIFYSGGYAIHHTDAVTKLGTRASHGCVRFHLEDINWINEYAKQLGNQSYELRKWSHSHHPEWKKIIHYKGLDTEVNAIDAKTGKLLKDEFVKSLDVVILVKDQRQNDSSPK